jgi:class 3 adenylate cyclase
MESNGDLSFVSDSEDESASDDEASVCVGKEEMSLWTVEDLIGRVEATQKPVVLGPGKRDSRQKLHWEEKVKNEATGSDDNNDVKSAKRQFLLLPETWLTLIAVPCFSNDRVDGIVVLANTGGDDEGSYAGPEDISNSNAMAWWTPLVATMYQDFMNQKTRLNQLSEKTHAVEELETKLRESLRRHSEMIHGILPPMAISKLKVQPQQWRSPLQCPVPTVAQFNPSDFNSVHDSSISGSIGSRYGLMIGGPLPSLDSESTFNVHGNNLADSDYQLYSLSENDEKRDKSKAIPTRSNSTNQKASQPVKTAAPARSSSVSNMNAMLRMHRQSSMTNRATGRPIFSRMDSGKRGMLMMPGPNLVRMDSGRFGRPGIPRLNSLKSLHGAIGINTNTASSIGGSSIDTMDQSWRTMYTNDESISSINPEDLPKTRANSISRGGGNVPSTEVSQLTGETVRYINSGSNASSSAVQALYAAHKPNVSIIFMSVVNFPEVGPENDPSGLMNVLAKLVFNLDRLCTKYGALKVEIVGTTILVMSGLFTEETDKDDEDGDEDDTYASYSRDRKSAVDALELAKEMVSIAQTIPLSCPAESTGNSVYSIGSSKKQHSETLNLRVGIHLGNVTYGVIGQNVPKLSCFGDALAVAHRLEQTANENCIRASKVFHDFVGRSEKAWDDTTKVIYVFRRNNGDDNATVSTAMLSSASSSLDFSTPCHPNLVWCHSHS